MQMNIFLVFMEHNTKIKGGNLGFLILRKINYKLADLKLGFI